jgi:hypothetical protein
MLITEKDAPRILPGQTCIELRVNIQHGSYRQVSIVVCCGPKVESLFVYPATESHLQMPCAERRMLVFSSRKPSPNAMGLAPNDCL